MKLGMVGLGRMGANMVLRLEQDGHEVVTYTRSGRGNVQSLQELVSRVRCFGHRMEYGAESVMRGAEGFLRRIL